MIWANLIHLSYNMWCDCPRKFVPGSLDTLTKPYLRFDMRLWNDLLKRMSQAGMNMVVLDLGDGVLYDSHPEIAVRNAWTPAKLRIELGKARDLGLEPIPKLNFSACHDNWLGPYARCLSTDTYYRVCTDLIAEVIDLFDTPRFFHLGMDEETAHHQTLNRYVVVRQYDLWWHDLLFLAREVKKGGSRAWIWSDYIWHHAETFFQKMPRSILQSNWWYGAVRQNVVARSPSVAPGSSGKAKYRPIEAYVRLEEHHYDQIPTGSNWGRPGNFQDTVNFGRRHISPKHLKGFLQTPWRPTLMKWRKHHYEAVDCVAEAIGAW